MQQEATKYWHDPTLNNLELLHATYITHTFAPHVHEGYAIGTIVAGAETFAYRGANHIAGVGDIVLVNPAEVHTGQALTKQGWTYRMLYPAAEQLQRAATQLTGHQADYPFFPHAVVQDPRLAKQLCDLHQQLEANIDKLTRESLWLAFLTTLIARHADNRQGRSSLTPQSDRAAIQRALEYLHDNYARPISLNDLASLTYLSPYHLLRLFKAEVGLPPHAYLTQLRIHRAKAFISTGLALADVAQQVGFTDQSHLTRHFKRIIGVSPGQYR